MPTRPRPPSRFRRTLDHARPTETPPLPAGSTKLSITPLRRTPTTHIGSAEQSIMHVRPRHRPPSRFRGTLDHGASFQPRLPSTSVPQNCRSPNFSTVIGRTQDAGSGSGVSVRDGVRGNSCPSSHFDTLCRARCPAPPTSRQAKPGAVGTMNSSDAADAGSLHLPRVGMT